MKTRILRAVCAFSMMVLSGCVKDRTKEDWDSEHDAQIRQQVRDVSGDYSGSLSFDTDGFTNSSAAMELHLQQCTRLGAPGGTQSATLTAVCGTLRIPGAQPISLGFQNGAYDVSRNEFRAQVQVPGRPIVSIEGVVSNQFLSGRVVVEGYPNQSGYFQLDRGAALLVADNSAFLRLRQGASSGFQRYQGTPYFTDGLTHAAMRMTVIKPPTQQEQDFADLLMPVRYVDVSFNFGPDVDTVFRNAIWDRRLGTLVGKAESQSATGGLLYGLELHCHDVVSGENHGWSCEYSSYVNRPGVVFTGSFLTEGSVAQ